MRLLSPILLLLLIVSPTLAETKLASIFTESMVLQQQSEVTIWGTDEPEQIVQVAGGWGETSEVATDDKGKWRLKLKTPQAGGPYSLEVQGSTEVEFNDILIGEVWLCSGQSNMQMTLRGNNNEPINGSQEAILNSTKDNIRVFYVNLKDSQEPLDSVTGQWHVSNPHTAPYFSATAYFFAQKLQASLDVPIGLITTSWGASSAEAWTDKETLEALGIDLSEVTNHKWRQQHPSVLYNGMIHPLVGYTMKGCIWYQGESNKNRAAEYRDLITAMVTSWRAQWGQGDFPFYYVQIAPFWYGPKNSNSAFLREAQLQTMETLKNSGMAVTLDIGDPNNIHPREKKTIGDRLAYWALANDYGIPNIETSGPIYDHHTVTEDGKLKIQFRGAPMGINSFGKELSGFTIASEDRIFHPAKAKIGKSPGELTVWSDKVPHPIAVRYAFENTPEATLFSTSGLPASSFRTDDWEEKLP